MGILSVLLLVSLAGCAEPGPSVVGPAVDAEKSSFTLNQTVVMTDPSDSLLGVVRVVDTDGETVMGAEVTLVVRVDSREYPFVLKPTDESGRTAFSLTSKELLSGTFEAHVLLRGAEVVLNQKHLVQFVAGLPRSIVFTQQPDFSGVAGAAVGRPVSVSAVDAYNHPVTRRYPITLSLSPDSTASRLEGTLTAVLEQGTAVFPDLRILGAGYARLVASVSSAPSATSIDFVVTPGPATQLRFETPLPASVQAGAPLASDIAVAVTDAYGNPRFPPCSRGELYLEREGRRSPLMVSRYISQPLITFPPAKVLLPGAEVRLVAHCEGLPDQVSTPFQVLVGPPDAAVSSLRATPERVVAGATAQALLRVQLMDAGGNPVVDAPVQLSVEGAGVALVPASGAGRTDAHGVFSATLASTTPQEVRVSATAGGLEMRTDVSFVPACSATVAFPSLPVLGPDMSGAPPVTSQSKLLPVDLDRDGHLDVVSADGFLYDNAGDGTLVVREHEAERVWGTLAAGDLDGDGAPDLLYAGDLVTVRFNRGDGSFFPSQPLGWGATNVRRAWVVDVNGDGWRDVAYSAGVGSPLTLHVLLNQGGGVFAPVVSSPLMQDADERMALVSGGPGEGADAVVFKYGGSTLQLFRAGADGRFVSAGSQTLGAVPIELFQADVDGDGREDVLARRSSGGGGLTLVGHPGPGRLSAPVEISTSVAVGTLAVADLDGDGWKDIAFTSASYPPQLRLVRSDGAGGFLPSEQLSLPTDIESVAAADLTGDGRAELLVDSRSGVLPLLNRGDGTFPTSRTLGISGAYFLVRGDFNGDGVVDVGGVGAGRASLSLSQPDGSRVSRSVSMPGSDERAGAAADLDGDGLSDLVVLESTLSKVYVMRNAGDGSFTPAGPLPLEAAPGPLAAGDLDGDGAPDLVVLLPSLGQANLLRNDGKGTLSPWSAVPLGPSPSAVALADLNGDGHLDLVVAHTGDGSVRRFLNDGTGGLVLQSTVTAGTRPGALAVGDVDGDGVPEVVAANSEGTVAVLPGSGGPARVYPVGLVPIDVALGDFNGDGHPDIAVANSTAYRVGLLLGQEGGGFSRHQWQAGLLLVHALLAMDWEGDGRVELLAAHAGGGVDLLTATCVR